MARRYTRKDAEVAGATLAKVMHKTWGMFRRTRRRGRIHVTANKRYWYMDYAPGYGGCVIIDQNGGRPFGDTRLSPQAFYHACWFAIRAIEYRRKH